MEEIKEKSVIIKRRMKNNFVMIPNDVLTTKILSLKAKGLLCYLLHLKDETVIKKTDLHKIFKDGREAVAAGFKELVDEGYVVPVQTILKETGHFFYSYIIYDEPIRKEEQIIDKNSKPPLTAFPYTVKPLTVNTEPNNNTINSRINTFKESILTFKNRYSDEMLDDFFEYWSEPNKSNKKMRCELEKTWKLAGRLKTWHKRSLGFNNQLSEEPIVKQPKLILDYDAYRSGEEKWIENPNYTD